MNNKDIYTTPPLIFVIGMNHKTAPLEVREKMYLRQEQIPAYLNRFKDMLSECMVVSTCNRFELYGVSSMDVSVIEQVKGGLADDSQFLPEKYFYDFILCGAVAHLFRVASSVDSMVIGDSQILSQVKDAYRIAVENGSAGKVLNQLVQKALHTAKKCKTETPLFEGAFSISYAAVELATKIFGDLSGKKVLVIGAGKTSELTVHNLIKKNASQILVTNRTIENAGRLVESLHERFNVGASTVEFGDIKSVLKEIDIVISSTGSDRYIIDTGELKPIVKQRRGEPILIIDIAVPRDIDPLAGKLEGIFLKNIDDLSAIVDSNYERRMAVVPQVDVIVSREVNEFLKWYYSIPLLPALRCIQQSGNGTTEIKKVMSYIEQNVSVLQQRMSWRQKEDIIGIHNMLVDGLQNLNNKIVKNNSNLSVCEACEYEGKGGIHICPPIGR
jgi:glutamyl-tRNA reductase